jgi:hypothetical protein
VSNRPLLFAPETVARIQSQFASIPEHFRPVLWRCATDPQLEQFRAWLEDELHRLEPTSCALFLSRLTDEARFTQALAELTTGYILRQPGYSVQYGPEIDGLTPDLIVTDPWGRRLVVEVWRRGLPELVNSRNKQWAQLGRSIQRIPVSVALAVDTTSHDVVEPPDAATRKVLERQLRAWLKSRRDGDPDVFGYEHYLFRIVGTTNSEHAELLPVRDGATVSRKDVADTIERKVKRYRRLAEQYDMPFLVVLSADDDTAMDASHVDSILAGKNSVSVNLPIGGIGAIQSPTIELRWSEAAPVFDSALSGVGWLDIRDGVHARCDLIWTNPNARRPVQPLPEHDASNAAG